MVFRNYVLLRKDLGTTKITSLKQQRRVNPNGFRYYCFQGKLITSYIKVIPHPSDAVVTLIADGYTQVGNSIIVHPGKEVNINVSKEGYFPRQIKVNTEEQDYFVNVELIKEGNAATLTVNAIPSDAIITLIADGYTQVGNSIIVEIGTLVQVVVEKEGYITQIKNVRVTQDATIDVELKDLVTVTINPIPSEASVELQYMDKIIPEEWGQLQSFGISAVPADDVRGSYARKCFCFVTDKGSFVIIKDMDDVVPTTKELKEATFYEGNYENHNSAWWYGQEEWEPAIAETIADRINYYVNGEVVRNIRFSTLEVWGWRDGNLSHVIDGYTYNVDEDGKMSLYYDNELVLELK